MKQVKRFNLAIEPSQSIDIPFNSELLGTDGPALLVLIDTDAKIMTRNFLIIAEGKELSQRANRTNYIGRFQAEGHVLHVFEE